MEIAVDKMGDVAIAELPVEELDASNAGEFKRDIAPLLEAHTKLVIDLSRLRFVDSSGLGAFISCLRKLNAKGGDLKLCGMSKQVRAVFELVRMHRIFDIFGTREEALRAFQGEKNAGVGVNNYGNPTIDSVSDVQDSICRHAKYSLGKAWRDLSPRDLFTAVALSVRDQMVDRMLETEERYQQKDPKRLYYLSIEFLIGQSLGSNLYNLRMRELYRQALRNLGADLEEIEESEPDAALGNGGLGRLAACFLDSLATLGMPGYGYGINYEYGLFKQEIDNGYQREKPDNWLAQGTPWQIARPDEACLVPVYGRIEHSVDRKGAYNPMWMDWKVLIGIPYDMPIAGYGGQTVNFLRLYSARASRDFDMQIFNDGDYFKAVEQKIASETISKVLYPSDAIVAGQELRLVQEYFLVACAVRDIVRRFEQNHDELSGFPRQGRDSTERHTSRSDGRGIDAHPCG